MAARREDHGPTQLSGVLLGRYTASRRRDGTRRDGPEDALTPRELEILRLAAEGHRTKDVGRILGISPKTVERHRSNIAEKLDLRDRVELTRYAIKRGLVEL